MLERSLKMKKSLLSITFICVLGLMTIFGFYYMRPYTASAKVMIFKPAGEELFGHLSENSQLGFDSISYNFGDEVIVSVTDSNKAESLNRLMLILDHIEEWGEDEKNQRYNSVTKSFQNPLHEGRYISVKRESLFE